MVDPLFALTVFAGSVTVLMVIFWPRRGIYARLSQSFRLTKRVQLEDALKHFYMWEQVGRTPTLESIAGRLTISTDDAAQLVTRLTESDFVHPGKEGLTLTKLGRESALRLVRTHRLWERYLADRTGVPAVEWHDEAEIMEHSLSAEQTDALSARLGHPRWDPHGDPIPTASGALPAVEQLSLGLAPLGMALEVIHLEDEPREIFNGLLNRGLVLGGRVEAIERDNRQVRVLVDGSECRINMVEAQNVTVRVLPEGQHTGSRPITLADLDLGETARVIDISPACRGSERRRLLDLGVVRGTEIRVDMESAAGDPVAYLIRGALIALRRSQATWIRIERAESFVEVAD
jgi:DtxR family Mn-dependent transcriptional regulator